MSNTECGRWSGEPPLRSLLTDKIVRQHMKSWKVNQEAFHALINAATDSLKANEAKAREDKSA